MKAKEEECEGRGKEKCGNKGEYMKTKLKGKKGEKKRWKIQK